MNTGRNISFTSIAGITPDTSTFADVMNKLGIDYKVERIPSRRGKIRQISSKVALHYQDLSIVVVFITPDFNLPPETLVSVVGAEISCQLQTSDSLRVGLPLTEAMAIIEKNYTVHHQSSGCIEIVPLEGESPTFVGICHNNDRIEFIGLYLREPMPKS